MSLSRGWQRWCWLSLVVSLARVADGSISGAEMLLVDFGHRRGAASSLKQNRSTVDAAKLQGALVEHVDTATFSPPHNLSFDPRIVAESRRGKITYAAVLGALVMVAVAPVLLTQGWWAFISLSTLLLSLTVVQVAMRAAFHGGLPYPYSLTAIHMLLTLLTAFASGLPKPGEFRLAIQTLPSSLAGGAAVLLTNVALTQASVSFVTMLGSCTPVLTFCMELSLGLRRATWKSMIPVVMACVGGALCVRGEHSSSLLALVLVMLGCGSRSVKSIWQQQLLNLDQLQPARLAAWGALWTFLMTLPFVVCWEGAGLVRHFTSASKSGMVAAFVSCSAAVLLNLSQWTSMRYLGPVMQNMFGNLQLVFVLILASVWLDEACSIEQVLGTSILVLGVLVAKVAPIFEGRESAPTQQTPLKAAKRGYLSTRRSDIP
ncbi:unnamed protein product [Effrenium voratum]|uniref:Sugar phosphate transporter domain-containing protein n=1 Tax=Effrenium voratum TaxID=2562239 RepID=A0AA36IF59_9DINO|nr:unnamed protein product [Effrenium voratum]